MFAFCGARITLDFLEALVTGHRRDLVRRSSRLGQRGGTSLAQSMCRAVMQVRLVALIAKPVAKPCRGERAAQRGYKIK